MALFYDTVKQGSSLFFTEGVAIVVEICEKELAENDDNCHSFRKKKWRPLIWVMYANASSRFGVMLIRLIAR